MTRLLALALVSLPSLVFAQDIDTYCELAQARAQVQSSVLSTPSAYATAGSTVLADKILTFGVSKSLSGSAQARLVEELANAECAAYRSKSVVGNELRDAAGRVELRGLTARKAGLLHALVAANQSLEDEQLLMRVQNATLLDVKAAMDARDRVALELRTIDKRLAALADLSSPGLTAPLGQLVQDSVAAKAAVERLSQRVAASRSWDVSLQAGVRRNFTTGEQAPYVGIAMTWSFGQEAANNAANSTEALTRKLLSQQRDSEPRQFQRLTEMMVAQADAERSRQSLLDTRQGVLSGELEKLESLPSTLAQRVVRGLRLELKLIEAELSESRAQSNAIHEWLTLNRNH